MGKETCEICGCKVPVSRVHRTVISQPSTSLEIVPTSILVCEACKRDDAELDAWQARRKRK